MQGWMPTTYSIAGIEFNIFELLTLNSDGKVWSAFATDRTGAGTITIVIKGSPDLIEYGIEKIHLDAPVRNVLRFKEDLLLTDSEWLCCTIFPLRNPLSFQVFTNQIFLTHAVQRHMIQLHASLIDDHGRGVVFLGPSGIGKTTQAERWMQYRGASILNGDMVFVQETQGPGKQYLGWGTPWHGSSPYCLNASVPVKALVVLKQAPENRLRELTGFEKVAEVSGSVFYPTWLETGMELCTDTLNHLLTDLPVYRLNNRADEAAVNLLAAELDRIT